MPGKRLYRSLSEKKIAGVCGGIADYFDVDPVFVRVAALLMVFLNGLGVIAYLICWAAIPAGTEGRPAEQNAPSAGDQGHAQTQEHPAAGIAARATQRFGQGNGELIAGGVLIFIGLVFLLLNVGFFDWEIFRFWRWRFIWPVILIALGLYVVSSSVKSASRGAGKGAL